MNEIKEAAKILAQTADPGARIILGAYHDRRLRQNQFKVILIATGFNGIAAAHSLFEARAGSGKDIFLGESRKDEFPRGEFAARERAAEARFSEEPFQEKGSSLGADLKKSGKPESAKKKESDMWDIPTFLRRKKK